MGERQNKKNVNNRWKTERERNSLEDRRGDIFERRISGGCKNGVMV